MALIKCPECKKNVSETAESCPNCGHKFSQREINDLIEKKRKADKQRGIGCLVVIAFIIITNVIAYFAVQNQEKGKSASNKQTKQAENPKPKVYKVMYEITGTTSEIDVTYSNLAADGDTAQDNGMKVPWRVSFKIPAGAGNMFLYVSAQNKTEYGCVTAKIYLDGVLWKENQSCGEYSIVTTSGNLSF